MVQTRSISRGSMFSSPYSTDRNLNWVIQFIRTKSSGVLLYSRFHDKMQSTTFLFLFARWRKHWIAYVLCVWWSAVTSFQILTNKTIDQENYSSPFSVEVASSSYIIYNRLCSKFQLRSYLFILLLETTKWKINKSRLPIGLLIQVVFVRTLNQNTV